MMDIIFVIISFASVLVAIAIIVDVWNHPDSNDVHFTPEQMKRFEDACCGDNPPKER